MANEKIGQMPSGFPVLPTDAVPIARSGSNYSVQAGALASLVSGIQIQPGGNTSGTTAIISTGLMFLAGGNNITLSQVGQAVTISAGASGAGFSGGVSGGNTIGTSGLTGSQFVIAGGNNITLSQSNGTAGASITISGGSQSVQTQNAVDVTLGGNTAGVLALVSSGTLFLAGGPNVTLSQNGQSISISAGTAAAANLSISAGTTSGAFGGVTFSNSNGVSFGLNNGTITATVAGGFSGGVSTGGNTSGNTGITGSNIVLAGGNNVTLSQLTGTAGATITVSAANQTVQTQNVVDVTLGGNTSGALALVSSGTLFLAGGNNVTLSQNGNSITISANTVAAANLSISAGTTSGAFGGVTFNNANNNTWGLNNGTLTVSAPINFSAGTTSGNVTALTLSNSNNVSFGLNAGTITASASQSVQTQDVRAVTLAGNTAGVLALISSGTMSLAGGGNITVSQAGNAVTIVGGAGNFSAGVSNLGNTIGNTAITGSQLVLSGGNNITLSQVTGANGATVGISAFTQSNQTLGVYASSQTIGQSSSSNIDARFFTHVGQGNISIGLSAGSLLFSGSQSVQTMGIYGSSQTTGQSSSSTIDVRSLSIVGAGIISVGMSQGSLLISAPASTGISQSVYATGNTTQSSSGTASIGSLLFQGAGNVSVGMTNGSVVISGNSAAPAPMNFSAGTTSGNIASVVFSNSNNISFGLAGSTITGSVPGISTLTGVGGITISTAAGNITISAPATSSIVGAGQVSISTNGSTISVSAPVQSIGISGGNTAGNTGTVSNQLVLAGGNNITLSGSTNATGMTVTISGGAGGAASASLYGLGNTTQNSSTVLPLSAMSFNGLGEATVGFSNGSIQISVPPSSIGVSNIGNTLGNTGTYSGQAVFVGGNNITLSVSSAAGGAQSITISGPNVGGAQTGISGIIVSNTTYTSGTVSFSNANGISFGSSAGQAITASYTVPSTAGLLSSFKVSGGASSAGLTALTFSNSNNVTFGLSTGASVGTMTGSFAMNMSAAGGTSNALSGLTFSNINGVSFGLSTGAGVGTLSASVAAQSNQNLSLFGLGNTTQNSSTVLGAAALSFNGLGAQTVGFSNGSIQLSVPATSSVVGTGLVSVVVNASTISIGAAVTQMSFFQPLGAFQNTTVTQNGNGSVQVYPVVHPFPFTATRADIMASLSAAVLAVSTQAQTISMYVGLYSLNASTLSLASSGSQSYAFTNSSNNSNASITGIRRFSAPINVNYTGGFDLFVGVMTNTTFVNTNGISISNVVMPIGPGQQLQGLIGQVPASSMQFMPGQGIFSTTSAGMPSSMALSAISGAGSGGNAVDYYSPVQFANVTA